VKPGVSYYAEELGNQERRVRRIARLLLAPTNSSFSCVDTGPIEMRGAWASEINQFGRAEHLTILADGLGIWHIDCRRRRHSEKEAFDASARIGLG
jgi:hypothetical protein